MDDLDLIPLVDEPQGELQSLAAEFAQENEQQSSKPASEQAAQADDDSEIIPLLDESETPPHGSKDASDSPQRDNDPDRQSAGRAGAAKAAR